MKHDILHIFVIGLFIVSFVSATDFIIINPDYNCTDSNTCPFIIFNDTNYTFPEPPYFFNITLDTTPPVISNVQAVLISENTVNVSWETNEPSYFNMIEYGKGRKYDHEVSQQFNTNLTSIMISQPSILLTLSKHGNYHYKIQSCDMFGNCAYSSDYKIKKK